MMTATIPDIIYFECHITLEPVFGETLEYVNSIVSKHGFKLAKLFMQKERVEKPERSSKDTFCTAHSNDYEDLFFRMRETGRDLEDAGFKVWRSKIEAILFDERMK